MAEESFQERTEQATPKKREEARQKGNVAKSMELNSALILLAGITTLYFTADTFVHQITGVNRTIFQEICCLELRPENLQGYLIEGTKVLFKILGPFICTIMAVGLLVNYIQVGVLFTGEPLLPKLDKLNPISGAKKLISKRALAELLKGILKIAIVGYVAYLTIKAESDRFLFLADKGVTEILVYMGQVSFKVALRSVLLLLVLAIADYGFQKWEYEKGLRMTKQEMKEEHKEAEGDPLVRSRIRSVQREFARRRMMKNVPEADVVITNPVELAVALKYDTSTMNAPVVIAKGARLIAQKIKEIAEKYDVPIVEDKPLAQLLYRTTEVDMEIPVETYKAVAEILGYIYRLRGIK